MLKPGNSWANWDKRSLTFLPSQLTLIPHLPTNFISSSTLTTLYETTSHTPTKTIPHPTASPADKMPPMSPPPQAPSPPCHGFHEALRCAPNCSHSSSITKAKIGLNPLVGEAAPPWEGHDWGVELWFAHVQLSFGRWSQSQ